MALLRVPVSCGQQRSLNKALESIAAIIAWLATTMISLLCTATQTRVMDMPRDLLCG